MNTNQENKQIDINIKLERQPGCIFSLIKIGFLITIIAPFFYAPFVLWAYTVNLFKTKTPKAITLASLIIFCGLLQSVALLYYSGKFNNSLIQNFLDPYLSFFQKTYDVYIQQLGEIGTVVYYYYFIALMIWFCLSPFFIVYHILRISYQSPEDPRSGRNKRVRKWNWLKNKKNVGKIYDFKAWQKILRKK